jgi:hypothetical protein
VAGVALVDRRFWGRFETNVLICRHNVTPDVEFRRLV